MNKERVFFLFVSAVGDVKLFLVLMPPGDNIEFKVLEMLCGDDLAEFTFIAALNSSMRVVSTKRSYYSWNPSSKQRAELQDKLVEAELQRLRPSSA
jgi:hypothetical protein